MSAFLQANTTATLGFLSVGAGFLIIAASVVFVIKGKAVLNESGAPNTLEWSKIKLNLTSSVALFVLGAAMIALPFWKLQQQDYMVAQEPTMASVQGKFGGAQNVKLLLVVQPDYVYDQLNSAEIDWHFPLVAKRTSYAVLYVQGDTVIGSSPIEVPDTPIGHSPPTIALPSLDVQSGAPSPYASIPEVKNADIEKSLVVR
jgi:hypothetical protein